jgi:erythromycin esterase
MIQFSFALKLLFFSAQLWGQQQLNLGFEKTSVEGIQRPWGWEAEYFLNHQWQMDSLERKEGKYSLKMWSEELKSKENLNFSIEAYELRQKEVTVEGWIKTKEVSDSAYLLLGYTVGSQMTSYREYESRSKIINGSQDWTLVKVVCELPDSADYLYVEVAHFGSGESWFDGFQLEVNGKVQEAVEVAVPFDKKSKSWLEKKAYPLKSVKAEDSFDDLAVLGKMTQDAEIIALGEATHGTSEFFSLKHRVLKEAVEKWDVRLFAIEDHQLIVQGVNRYVLGGDMAAKSTMSWMFTCWKNQEVLGMIEWVRAYNDEHTDDPVQFMGFDMQYPVVSVDSLDHFVQKHLPEEQETLGELMQEVRETISWELMNQDSMIKKRMKPCRKLFEIVSSKEDSLLSIASSAEDSMEVCWGVQYARLLLQFAESMYRGYDALYRDEAMAENVLWLKKHFSQGKKMVIWAHDVHISLGQYSNNEHNYYYGRSMGSFLRKAVGDKYKSYGIWTYEGDYRAQLSYFDQTLMNCPMHDAPKGSWEEVLHQISCQQKAPGLIVDLTGSREVDGLCRPIPVRFANHVNIEYGYWTRYVIPYQFDGVLFWDKTSSAKSFN